MQQQPFQSKKNPKPTTLVRLPVNFRERANAVPVHAMFYMFTSAFGYSLADGIADVEKIFSTGNWPLLALCLASSVQVRGNVVALAEDIFHIRDQYPKLHLPGRQGKEDVYNFFGLHLLGHIILNLAPTHRISQQGLSKAGDCVFGRHLESVPTEAHAINKEIADSWTAEAKQVVIAYIQGNQARVVQAGRIFDVVEPFSIEFAAYLENPASVPTGSITGQGQNLQVEEGDIA